MDSVGFGRVAHALGREHRTEVTEATEEDEEAGCVRAAFCGQRWFWAGNTCAWERASHRGHGGLLKLSVGGGVFANADQRDDDDGAYDVKQGQAGEQRSIAHRGGQRPNDQGEG